MYVCMLVHTRVCVYVCVCVCATGLSSGLLWLFGLRFEPCGVKPASLYQEEDKQSGGPRSVTEDKAKEGKKKRRGGKRQHYSS